MIKKGDRITLTYVPGKGTIVSAKNVEKGVIEGYGVKLNPKAIGLPAAWLAAD